MVNSLNILDDLPIHICLPCVNKLIDSWEFRNLFIASDTFLRSNQNSVHISETATETNKTSERDTKADQFNSNIPDDLNWNDGLVDNDLDDYLDLDLDVPKIDCQVNEIKEPTLGPTIKSTIPATPLVYHSTAENLQDEVPIQEESNEPKNNIDFKESKDPHPDEEFKKPDLEKSSNELHSNTIIQKMQLRDANLIKPYECKKCKKLLQTELSQRRHRNCHRKNKTKCPICPKMFSHTSNLKRHLLVHKGSTDLTCDKCNKSFENGSALYEHIKIHWNNESDDKDTEYMLQCDLCNEKTVSFALFYNHMRKEHQITDKNQLKPFKCRVCKMSFASKQGMFRHIDNIHENNRRNLRNRDKNFLCNTCGKSFYTNFHLDVHVRSHTGERPFKCPVCDKAFSQMSGLKMHTFIHTGERPFRCKLCPKSFNQYGHVREHMLTHSDQRPHVCTVCNHSFRVKGNLTAHMLIHTGKKPFTCQHCGRRFLQSTKLKQHITKKHTNQPDTEMGTASEID